MKSYSATMRLLLLSAAILAASYAQDDCPFCPDGFEVGTDVQIMDPEAEGFTCGQAVEYALSLRDRGILETDCPIVTAWMGECCADQYAAIIGGVEVEAEPTAAIIIVDKGEKHQEEEEDFLPEEATGEPAESQAAASSEPAGIIARPESCGDEVYSCLVAAEPDLECAEAIHEECMDTSSGCLEDASPIIGSPDLLCMAAECLILFNPEPDCRCQFVINECYNSQLSNISSGEVTSESGAALVGDESGVSDRVCIESQCCAVSESVEDKARCFGSEYAEKFVEDEKTTVTWGTTGGFSSGSSFSETTSGSSTSSSSSSWTDESSSFSGSSSESSGWTGEGASSSSWEGSVGESGGDPGNQPFGSESAPSAEGYGNETMPADAWTDYNGGAEGSAVAGGVAGEDTNRDGDAGSVASKDPKGGSSAPRHGAVVLTAAAVALTVCSLA